MKPEHQTYAEYYESTLRTMRAVKPMLTREQAFAMIKRHTLEDCEQEGDSPDETSYRVAFAERRFNEAWEKTEVVSVQN